MAENGWGKLKSQVVKILAEGGYVKVPSGKRLMERPDVGFVFLSKSIHYSEATSQRKYQGNFFLFMGDSLFCDRFL